MEETGSRERDRQQELERMQRSARFFGVIGPLLFFFGMALAAVGGWFVFGPGIEGVDEMSGTVIFIVALILVLDGIFFTVLGRRVGAKARKLQQQVEAGQTAG